MLPEHRRKELLALYRDGLLNDTMPFWLNHAIDRECGGFFNALDADGTVLTTDKPMWAHGRFIWMLSTLYNTVEQKAEWLEAAGHGIEFLRKHAFDDDGRMFFWVTREGKPLRKRRYIFTETFGAIAFAAYARASGDEAAAQKARDLFELILELLDTPGRLEPKFYPETRQMKGLAVPMIMIVTAQVLRENLAYDRADACIDRYVAEVERDFMKPEFSAVLETVGPDGEFIDNLEGRMICPGHSIEAAWFMLHESKHRGNDPHLREVGLKILDWSWDLGWDDEYGGLLYYRDARGLSCTEYWHDMKFWWPHNEAIIATLLAYQLTGDDKYLTWHGMVHDWAYEHFPDRENGEWFGYLDRSGRLSTRVKGNMWKGPFHLPRMQWYCWKLLEEMSGAAGWTAPR